MKSALSRNLCKKRKMWSNVKIGRVNRLSKICRVEDS
jgi:hypothetical protein